MNADKELLLATRELLGLTGLEDVGRELVQRAADCPMGTG